MAARWGHGYLDQKKGEKSGLDLQRLSKGVCCAIIDQDLIVCGDNRVPIGTCGKAARGCASGQSDRVWQGGCGCRRETHDKQGEDS